MILIVRAYSQGSNIRAQTAVQVGWMQKILHHNSLARHYVLIGILYSVLEKNISVLSRLGASIIATLIYK